ncbi:hypothetical protein JGE46_23680, partial [Salmonella enterica subsp. enterica serovar Mbandaka]|nr:hypothetical protein [Salmonella enterica subsp. enterica serovar Mbandaka]
MIAEALGVAPEKIWP